MILIYMNTGEWGGVDIFVTRFAHHLRRIGRDFVIVDKEGSRLRRDLAWARFITPDEAAGSRMNVDRVFLPSVAKLREGELPWRLVKNASVFAWIVQHHDVLYQFFPYASRPTMRWGFRMVPYVFAVMRGHARRISAMLDAMTRCDALAAMDGSTIRSFRFFYPDATPPSSLIPLPVPLSEPPAVAASTDDTLTIGYLGRMDWFKFSALGPFVANELARIARSRPVTLVAITVGTHVEQLRQLCETSGVGLRLHGFMPNDEARATLARETHFAVAMGTAALDIAASGHPCVYIDPAEQAGCPPQTRFRFVHETLEYMPGEFRDFPGYVGGLRSLEDTIRTVMEDPSIGPRGREYVREHHDPDRINASILKHLDISTLTMGELEPLVAAVKASNARDLAFVARLRRVQRLIDPRRWFRRAVA